jgi:DNA polymerase III psi subunit
MSHWLQTLFLGEELYNIPSGETLEKSTPPATPTRTESPLPKIPEKQIVSLAAEALPDTTKKPLLVVVQSPSVEDMVLLSKILKAVKMDLEDIDLLDVGKLTAETLDHKMAQIAVSHLLTFGVPLPKLNLNVLLTPYQIKEDRGVKFLFADALSDLQNDNTRKALLWKCLQAMF